MIYIISDLHLSEQRPQMLVLFQQFLNKISVEGNQLFILGDFFDYWIGDDDLSEFHQQVISSLAEASDKGLTLFFMHGNRDFLIGKRFATLAKVNLIKDPYDFVHNDLKIRLTHGDLLCTDDKSYQRFRKIVRSTWFQTLYLSLPLGVRRFIAQKTRAKSQAKNKSYPNIDVTPIGVERYGHGFDILIHGHTHKFAIHQEQGFQRFVLSDWFEKGSYIKINQTVQLQWFQADPN